MLQSLHAVAARTPSRIDITSAPAVVTNHVRGTKDGLRIETLGTHQQADKFIHANLADATVVDVEGLIQAAIPKTAFPISTDLLFPAICNAGLYDIDRKRWQFQLGLRKPGAEPVIAQWLNEIVDAGRALFEKSGVWGPDHKPEVRKWSADFCDKELPDGVHSRKPDLAFILESEASWKIIHNDLQHKSNPKDTEAICKQLHDGAFNILTEQDDRIFHIGIAITGEDYFIMYYNRAGCYRSAPANVHEKAEEFVYLVLALALLGKSVVGFDPTVKVTNEGRFITMSGRTLKILNRQGREYNLRGAGPVHWRCIDAATNEKFTVKNIWADRSRNPTEWSLYERADRAGVQHMPKVVACEFVRDGQALITTDTLRQRLPDPSALDGIEVRDYMRILMEGHTAPLHEFTSKPEVIGAMRDAIRAHQMLCEEAEIMHLQVRDSTVVFDDSDDSKRGSRPGFLLDLGVAKLLNSLQSQPPSQGHKSCFGMYEAWEILLATNTIPQSHHDLESFYYVLLVLCATCSGDTDEGAAPRENFDLPTSSLGRWLGIDKTNVGSNKLAILTFKPKGMADTFDTFLDDVVDPFFDDFKPLLRKLRALLADMSRRPTHQDFIDVFESYIEAALPTATLPTVRIAKGADEEDGHASDSDDDQFDFGDDDSDEGRIADRDRLPDIAQLLAAPVPREQRAQAREVRFSAYTVDRTCECGEVLTPAKGNLIRCRELSCSTGLFHRGCMGMVREPPANSLEGWCCDNCKGKQIDKEWNPRPRKKARTDAI